MPVNAERRTPNAERDAIDAAQDAVNAARRTPHAAPVVAAPVPQWWQAAFASEYLTVYAHRDPAAAAAEIAALLPHLGQGPVLDACCGNGRHLAALRAAGVTAVGFDWSPDLLGAGLAPGCAARGDVRAIPLGGGFSAVLVLFTAFGYFDEADNRRALGCLADQLAPDGRLVLDLPDADRLEATLVPSSTRQVAGLTIEEHRRLDGPRVKKLVTITHADGRMRSYEESVRLYQPEEIAALAGSVGLRLADGWTGLRGPTSDEGRWVFWLERL